MHLLFTFSLSNYLLPYLADNDNNNDTPTISHCDCKTRPHYHIQIVVKKLLQFPLLI